MEQGEKYRAGPSDFLAGERTFLAWVRTGLALMALGFVLARFGLFLQQIHVVRPDVHTVSYGHSMWFGTVLILLGVLVSLAFASAIFADGEAMREGAIFRQHVDAGGSTAILLAILGLAMSYYLLATRHVRVQNHSSAKETSMATSPENGILKIASQHSVADTVAKLESILLAKNVKLFATSIIAAKRKKLG